MNLFSGTVSISLIALLFWLIRKAKKENHMPGRPVILTGIGIIVLIMCFLPWEIRTRHSLMQSSENVESVQIVRIDDYDFQSHKIDMKIKSQIDDIEWFLEEFQKVECTITRYKIVENIVGKDNAVFKINYFNGDYEMIDYRSRIVYTFTSGYSERRNIKLDRKQYRELLRACIIESEEE